jgi:hypothetical protein
MSKNTDLGSLVNYIKGQVTGRLNAPAYTSATAFTGTIAGFLGFDTSGNILTSAGVGLSGSGTTNFISKFTGSTALGNSLIYDNGTNVGISTSNPIFKLQIGTITGLGIATATPTCLTLDETFGNNTIGTNFKLRLFQDNAINTYGFGVSGALLEIISGTNGAIGFFTNGANQRMIIQSSGNISVGNTNNTYKLDVTGDVNISGTYRVNGTAIGGVTGSGSTNLMPLWTSTTGLGNSIIYNSGGNLGINSTTNGYTLNVIRSASTAFNEVYRGSGSTVQIMTRFMQDESNNRGIAIGYFSYSADGIWSTNTGALRLGILVGSSYKTKIYLADNTIGMDLPTSGGGLSIGDLYNDGGTVKIVT